MTEQAHRILSVEEAARILYRTDSPTEQQLGKIRMKLARGVLARGSRGGWTTTPEAIANYLAQREEVLRDDGNPPGVVVKSKRPRGKSCTPDRQRAPQLGAPAVKGFYGQLLRDYFLALALRRSRSRRSRRFDQAVVLGQIATLVLAGALLYSGYRRAFPALAPERAAVLAWLDTNAEEYDIVEWFPADAARDPGATIVRVKYKYFSSSHKRIVTDRLFTIRDGQVASVAQTD